ncbi:MAG: acetylxylan esterase [Acidobacteria bacterium]|nr:acetylxylan esterase [Acidobacteriota bacterium]
MNRRDWLKMPTMAALPCFAQQPAAAGPDRMLEREAEAILDRAAGELASKDEWERVRSRRRDEMRQMLGLDPWPLRTPLNVRITGTLDRGEFVVEKIAYESVPKFYVTGNLYLPKERPGKLPVILYVCGHSGPRQGAKTEYQRHGISFARNGYACLILDPIQIAETYSIHHGVQGLRHYDWYARGYTPAGVEVWNAIRALDYLASRPEIDIARAGMTGRSGGAAMTWFTAALDDRVRVAAPVMGISTYLANLRENTQSRHCDCMFVLNFHRHEMAHQGALIAPRPLLMAHGSKDNLFPVPGYTKFEELLTRLYASYGRPERFRNIVVATGHQDSDFLREQALRWFDQHLLGQTARPLKMEYENAPPESLAVFGGKAPADAINPRIHLVFRPAAVPTTPRDRTGWESRARELMAILREKVFARFPVESLPLNMRVRVPENRAKAPAVLYLVPAGETAGVTDSFLRFAGIPADIARVSLYPGDWSEHPRNAIEERDLIRNAMHVGLSPDTMRVGDVLRAIAQLASDPRIDPARITVAGRGADAGVVLYAAILEPRIAGVVMIQPAETHWSGPMFLNVLRYTDLPEAAGLLAPRRLQFFQRMPPAYRLTQQIYKLAGAADAIGECFTVA